MLCPPPPPFEFPLLADGVVVAAAGVEDAASFGEAVELSEDDIEEVALARLED